MAQNPISNMQASLAVTQYFPLQGVFPSQGGGGSTGFYLGEIGTFAGSFAPAGTIAAGQLAVISQNQALFSLLGTNFGGNGTTTFGLPNLGGTTMVGTGQGAGLSPETIGQKTGSTSVTINYPQAPPNLLGQSQSIDNRQPSLGVTYAIEIQGVFPSQGNGGLTPLNTLGMIKAFAGNFDAAGYVACNGQLLSIAQNQALFSLLGTTYGGNGVTTFALPDLRGRDIIGASAATPIGTKVGQANVNLVNGQAPTAGGGPVTPFDNRQPSLSLQYIIALQGIFPSQGGGQDPTTPFLGQIVAFAGTIVPSGWARCDGTLLSIAQNTALFALLGTFYGGNGQTTFALPDLRDRIAIGAGNGFVLGEEDGQNSTTITADQLAVPQPRFGGALVAPGQFDTWLPIDSVQSNGGYQIAWKHGAADEYIVWTTDGNGNWQSQGAVMSGTSFALESLEPTFGYDLNGDGTVGVVTTTIEALGATDLKQVANNFYLYAHGTSNGPQLKMSGAAVITGQFGAWTPIAAEASGGGYKVAWKNGATNEYLVWTTDGSGNWLSQTAAMAGTTYAMQSIETTYNQDLNGDGTVGPKATTIETIGTVDLKQVADTYFLYDHGTSNGPQLKMSGAAVTVGQFDTWTPLGAEKMANGYLAVWKHGAADEYTVWTIDGAGNWLSQIAPVPGSSAEIQSLEPGFNQNLNGVGGITPRIAIEGYGSTALAAVANVYVVSPISSALGPQLRKSGALYMAGQDGAWTPIGAEQVGNGYKVAWKNGAANEYLVWDTDAGGNWLSQSGVMSGTTYAMQSLETTYSQDLNGDGSVGPAVTTIEAIGTVDLKQLADTYFLHDHTSVNGPQLKMSGAAVTVGQFDTWTPIGAEKIGNGYLAVWKHGAADEYTVWTIDGAGNWLSQITPVPGSSAEIQSLEPGFNQNLNGVGGITPRAVIEAFGSTTLASIANVFVVSPTGSALGPQLRMSGALYMAGQDGAWTPIGAEKVGGGYKVAWKNGAADQYLVWDTDAGGNWLSQTAVMAGASAELKAFESIFQQDLNMSGQIGASLVAPSADTPDMALFTNYMASAFAAPAGEGTGHVADSESSPQPFLTSHST